MREEMSTTTTKEVTIVLKKKCCPKSNMKAANALFLVVFWQASSAQSLSINHKIREEFHDAFILFHFDQITIHGLREGTNG